jgi:hypothetical protein
MGLLRPHVAGSAFECVNVQRRGRCPAGVPAGAAARGLVDRRLRGRPHSCGRAGSPATLGGGQPSRSPRQAARTTPHHAAARHRHREPDADRVAAAARPSVDSRSSALVVGRATTAGRGRLPSSHHLRRMNGDGLAPARSDGRVAGRRGAAGPAQRGRDRAVPEYGCRQRVGRARRARAAQHVRAEAAALAEQSAGLAAMRRFRPTGPGARAKPRVLCVPRAVAVMHASRCPGSGAG